MNVSYHCYFFVLNNKKLSTHMVQIIEHINSSNQKIHSYDQMSAMVFNLGSKKGESKDNFSPQITRLQNSLLVVIVDTLGKDISNVYSKSDMRKIHTSSV